MSDCCHWDEGYDEGYKEGRKSVGDTSVHCEILEAVARRYDVAGNCRCAETLREVAWEIASWNLDHILEKERERLAAAVALYAEEAAA
ncbi:MAG: hypothetical protein H0W31_00065 [Actinobacteria bacterium]|nr:hypothetical protein [Actinomycetota bacterium]